MDNQALWLPESALAASVDRLHLDRPTRDALKAVGIVRSGNLRPRATYGKRPGMPLGGEGEGSIVGYLRAFDPLRRRCRRLAWLLAIPGRSRRPG